MDISDWIQLYTNIALVGVAFVQIIFLYVGYFHAMEYITEHKQKLKLEEERKILREILDSLYKLDSIFILIFTKLEYEEEEIDSMGNMEDFFIIATKVHSHYEKSFKNNQNEMSTHLHILKKNRWILEPKIKTVIPHIDKWMKGIQALQKEYFTLSELISKHEESFSRGHLSPEQENELRILIAKLPISLYETENEYVVRIKRELDAAKNECIKLLS